MKIFIDLVRKNERGVAILLVMSTIVILAAIMVEFSFRANVQYHLALNNADRIQAYYLAESGLNFSKLIIKFDKDVQKQIEKAGVTIEVDPLYRQFPFSSALLRMGLNEIGGAETDDAQAADDNPEDEAPEESDATDVDDEGGVISQAMDEADIGSDQLSMIEGKEAEDFLSFSGDFEFEISEVEAKYDLNAFYSLEKTQPDYDPRKRWLIDLFRLSPFSAYFIKVEDELRPEEMTYRMTDWVDQNESVDELGGAERGSENDIYREVDYLPKNGKMTSMEELGLIPGMTPELLAMLRPLVSIYNPSHQFNACLAEDSLVQALVLMYSETNTCASPIDIERDADMLDTLTTAFLGGCPKTDEMVQLLDEAMGLGLNDSEDPVDCGPFKLSDLLTDKRDIFQVTGRGTVNETTVDIQTVLDTSGENAGKWKFYYWRVN